MFMKINTESINPLDLNAVIQVVKAGDGLTENVTLPFTVNVRDILLLIEGLRGVAVMLEAINVSYGLNLGSGELEKEVASKAKKIANEARRKILLPEEEAKAEGEKP